MAVKVKICGITREVDARAVVDAGADYVGLNFVPTSPRRISVERGVAVARAAAGAIVVAVFADAEAAEVRQVAEAVGADLVQLHGSEPPAYCRACDRPVVKALRAPDARTLAGLAARYEDVAYLLVDAWMPGGQLGGTGTPLDVEAAGVLDPARLFVAGGLTPEGVAAVVARLRPYAVDVATGVESSPGIKDHGKVERFVRRAKAA